MSHCNLREEPNDFNKTYSLKFRKMNKDYGKLLEEDIKLHKFSLHQKHVDQYEFSDHLPSDRTKLEKDRI